MDPFLTATELRPAGRHQCDAMTGRKPRAVIQWPHLKFNLQGVALALQKNTGLNVGWKLARFARRRYAETSRDRAHRPGRQQRRWNRHRVAIQARQSQRLARRRRQDQQLRRAAVAGRAGCHHHIVAEKTRPIAAIFKLRTMHPEALGIFLQSKRQAGDGGRQQLPGIVHQVVLAHQVAPQRERTQSAFLILDQQAQQQPIGCR